MTVVPVECPKCAGMFGGPRYHPPAVLHHGMRDCDVIGCPGPREEHLAFVCLRCGFETTTPCSDQRSAT